MSSIIHSSSQHTEAPVFISFLPPGLFLEGVGSSLEWQGQPMVVLCAPTPACLLLPYCEVEGPRWLLSVRPVSDHGALYPGGPGY